MANKTEDQIYQEKARRIKKAVLKDFKSYAKRYFQDAKDTGLTPTEDQAVADVRKHGQYLFERNEDFLFLTAAQQQQVMDSCEQEIADDVRAQYRNYIDKHHPEVNGQVPYHVDDSWKKEVEPYVKEINSHVEESLNDFLGACAMKGACPNETQIKTCIEGWITRYREAYGPDFPLTEQKNLWLRKRLHDNMPQYLKTYHAYADTVDVTNTYPGGYPGVTTSAPPDPRKPNQKLPDGYVPGGKGGNSEPPVKDEKPKDSPVVADHDYGPKASLWTKTNVSFSGCDMVVSANMKTTKGHSVSVVIGSLQTVTYSIYRKLSPINNIGNINAKDYVGGPRTIAGSLIFTVLHQHWATELMDKFMAAEGYADSRKILMDEVAPIDLTISMANEFGVESRLAIYGVRLFSEGQTMSINDIYTENTYQYVALNIDYLANIHTMRNIWLTDEEFNARFPKVNNPDPSIPLGENSRVESSAPTDEQKYGVTTESPVYHQKAEDNPIHKAGERQKSQDLKEDTSQKDSRSKINQKIGNEERTTSKTGKRDMTVREMFTRVSTSDDVIEVIDGKTVSLKGKTYIRCSRLIGAFIKQKIKEFENKLDNGEITSEQLDRERKRLQALQELKNEEVLDIITREAEV